jgi:L-lactate dehydrogenase complex protein LldF
VSTAFLGMPPVGRSGPAPGAPRGAARGALRRGHGHLASGVPFPDAARTALRDTQQRTNLRRATTTIRAKRAAVVGELTDWEELREAGRAIKERTLRHLPELLERFEEAFTAAGGTVHWARDAYEANRIVTRLVRATGEREVVKVKSMVTGEIGLNAALARAGITAHETDLAELIVQLGHDEPSHILVPAIHKNRSEIREIFTREMPGVDSGLSDQPRELAMAARRHLREKFLTAKVGISGANFAIAETGGLCVVESEGNGRMCLTLPETLISIVGIEKLVPTWSDLEVYLQLLPRSSTGERMNPYTSLWTGRHDGDGPSDVHVVLLDNGRSAVLADEIGRQTLACIRCSACLNVCPVYERAGGHAYGSIYPGPIGAILSPQLTGVEANATLPYASSLCGACYDVCPVKINIPEVLVHLRAQVVDAKRSRRVPTAEQLSMQAMAWLFSDPHRLEAAQRAAQLGSAPLARGSDRITALPPPLNGWTSARDAPAVPKESFRAWWRRTRGKPATERTEE